MARLRAQAGTKERPPGTNKGTARTEEELSMTQPTPLTRRKTDRLCRYYEKAPCCGKSRKKPKPNATPIAELR
jgi:hypothetical protein